MIETTFDNALGPIIPIWQIGLGSSRGLVVQLRPHYRRDGSGSLTQIARSYGRGKELLWNLGSESAALKLEQWFYSAVFIRPHSFVMPSVHRTYIWKQPVVSGLAATDGNWSVSESGRCVHSFLSCRCQTDSWLHIMWIARRIGELEGQMSNWMKNINRGWSVGNWG